MKTEQEAWLLAVHSGLADLNIPHANDSCPQLIIFTNHTNYPTHFSYPLMMIKAFGKHPLSHSLSTKPFNVPSLLHPTLIYSLHFHLAHQVKAFSFPLTHIPSLWNLSFNILAPVALPNRLTKDRSLWLLQSSHLGSTGWCKPVIVFQSVT